MSEKLMLIDQFYDRETRVALVKGGLLEDFDEELIQNKLKKGNIYLGRVMRIEPSLQAAFIDYGEIKHGFLSFSELHPNEYTGTKAFAVKQGKEKPEGNAVPEPDGSESTGTGLPKAVSESVAKHEPRIQDVLKRNQLLIVQVVKDGRSTKGAALTTYISLPGKYSVLMPNTPRGGGGVSKKITASKDREAMKEIVSSLELPESMSIIVRTAGLGSTKREIKRDCDYLLRLWSDLSQNLPTVPSLLYEEQDLVIRALRDLYASDVSKILIQGEAAFKKAQTFMKMFMPTHKKKVEHYEDAHLTLFEKFGLQEQIQAIYSNKVTLPSGGSLIITPTEAVVSIDVNSGRSTQERHIEDTAFKTNLEAAPVIARQLRLRDLAGLIVIDFIDMSASRRLEVEKALKDALKADRARIQVGKISEFGLLEMSRQRLRQSLLESHTTLCASCHGSGRTLALPMLAMVHLKALEEKAIMAKSLVAYGPLEIVLYLLNEERSMLNLLEKKQETSITLKIDTSLALSEFRIEVLLQKALIPALAPPLPIAIKKNPTVLPVKHAAIPLEKGIERISEASGIPTKKSRRNRPRGDRIKKEEVTAILESNLMQEALQPLVTPMHVEVKELDSETLPKKSKRRRSKKPIEMVSMALLIEKPNVSQDAKEEPPAPKTEMKELASEMLPKKSKRRRSKKPVDMASIAAPIEKPNTSQGAKDEHQALKAFSESPKEIIIDVSHEVFLLTPPPARRRWRKFPKGNA